MMTSMQANDIHARNISSGKLQHGEQLTPIFRINSEESVARNRTFLKVQYENKNEMEIV